VADGVALREVYLRVFRLSQVSIILLILSTHSFIYFRRYLFSEPIPVVARSKVRVCGSSLAGIAASNPSGDMMSVSCECCVLSGRSLWDGMITRPEECVPECDCEGSIVGNPWRYRGCCAKVTNIVLAINKLFEILNIRIKYM
jgi:hypothetical protein